MKTRKEFLEELENKEARIMFWEKHANIPTISIFGHYEEVVV
jgi:hypothetical protein